MNEERIKIMKEIVEEVKKSKVKLKDIRYRDFMSLNTPAVLALKKLIDLEDIFINMDDYQMNNDQIYPGIEDMMLKIGYLRKDYTKYLEQHPELTLLTEEEME